MKTDIKKYAQKCDVTGKGMNKGYVWGDGSFYCIDDDKIALKVFSEEKEYITSLVKDNELEYKYPIFDNLCNYTKEEYKNLKESIKRCKSGVPTNEDLRDISYVFDLHYWTEWECEEDFKYQEINGKLIEYERV